MNRNSGEFAVRYPVDLNLFTNTKHSPTLPRLEQSMVDNGSDNAKLRDYCIPVNPYFPTHDMISQFHEELEKLMKYYPDPAGAHATLARLLGVPKDSLVLANGSTELITWIDHLYIRRALATTIPTFGRWTDQPMETGKQVFALQRDERKDFKMSAEDFVRFVLDSGAEVAAICNPNNPTGALFTQEELLFMADEFADLDLFIVDEAFIDFATRNSLSTVTMQNYAPDFGNMIVLKSLGKNFGLHGIRAGYGIASPMIASRISESLPKWNINAFVLALIEMLPKQLASYEASRIKTIQDRVYMEKSLAEIPFLTVFPSRANFNYVRLDGRISGEDLRNHLLTEYGLLLRECGNKQGSSSEYFRIATRPRAETDILIHALKESFAAIPRMDAWAV